MIIELPFPPSTNTYWRNVVIAKRPRVLISEKGRNYRKAVVDELLVQSAGVAMPGPIACTLDLYPPCNRRRDCDNHAKALLDALTHGGVYGDDSQIIDLRIRMHPKKPPGLVRVTLEPVGEIQSAHAQTDLVS